MHAHGEQSHFAKLDEAAVLAIRAAGANVSNMDLAKQHGVTSCCVGFVRRGESWKHVGGHYSRRFKISAAKDPRQAIAVRVTLDPQIHCWNWTEGKDPDGYGVIRWREDDKWQQRAHRLAYRAFIGPIPKGMMVCHRCDNPSCCQPAHLFLGTAQDNTIDRENKGRGASVGERNVNVHLTSEQVREIRNTQWTISQSEIAKRYGVKQANISRILLRQNWKSLEA